MMIQRSSRKGNNSDQPRVLFVSDHLGYAEGVIHGATTYFLNVLPALKKTGMPLTVCFLRDRHPAAERLEAEGIESIFLNRGKWDVRALGDLARLIREQDINLVHGAGMKGILLGRMAAHRTGARFLAHIHDTNPLDPVTKTLQRVFARWTDGCVGISKAVCEYAVETMRIPRTRVRVLYNALPPERFAAPPPDAVRAVRASLDIDEHQRGVAVIGRLSPEKGHDSLLCAGADWLKARPDICLLIVGDGPLRTSLQERVKSLGLDDQVRFAGYREDVPAVLAAADAVVIPSLREGLGYTALEAMAAGCPVAAFAVGGLPEIIRDGETGFLSPPGDYSHLLGQLERLLSDRAVAGGLAENGRQHAKKYSVESHVLELMSIYASLLDGTFDRPAGALS